MVEPKAAAMAGVSMYSLMELAGQAVVNVIRDAFPSRQKLLVLAGHGNNGGDAYVVARRACALGKQVVLCELGKVDRLSDDASCARQKWLQSGGQAEDFNQLDLNEFDLCVDGLLGTGIQGEVKEPMASIIKRINQSGLDVLSIDIPSGLHADTGAVQGAAIQAVHTVTFVGIKSGLVTGLGKQHCGQLHFDDLGIGPEFTRIAVPVAKMIGFPLLKPLPARPLAAHKGSFGKLLCIGGNQGYPGAIRLTGEAALYSGAGLVKVLCHEDSRLQVSSGRPELMVDWREEQLPSMLKWCDAVVVGPGLGKDAWAMRVLKLTLEACLRYHKSLVIDADAINLVSEQRRLTIPKNLAILTPHPAEAARLLNRTANEVESNRYLAARQISMQYDAVTLLKGAGSVVCAQNNTWVCQDGNPGMASPGMGDLLSGVLGSLLAQGMSNRLSCLFGVCLHSHAGDRASQMVGQRGLLASDLLPEIRRLVNNNCE